MAWCVGQDGSHPQTLSRKAGRDELALSVHTEDAGAVRIQIDEGGSLRLARGRCSRGSRSDDPVAKVSRGSGPEGFRVQEDPQWDQGAGKLHRVHSAASSRRLARARKGPMEAGRGRIDESSATQLGRQRLPCDINASTAEIRHQFGVVEVQALVDMPPGSSMQG